ncbi:hypothetical protein [Ruminococcus flavefaciens]|uniref:hypothetical protein n=1 Tax=Ruminococcus flavefaciens TaxID=1265 RepID=UPI0013D97FFF|nr:hypothetical protein [Ruminococcus flavefaciens]
MKPAKMKRCRCGEHVERHQDDKGKWFVYCSDCGLVYGVWLNCCEPFSKGVAVYDTAEQAAIAWNEWIGGGDDDES